MDIWFFNQETYYNKYVFKKMNKKSTMVQNKIISSRASSVYIPQNQLLIAVYEELIKI